MAFYVFLFLLVCFLLLSLSLLCRLSWPHLQLSHAPIGSRRALVHRLLKPRTPLDCPPLPSRLARRATCLCANTPLE